MLFEIKALVPVPPSQIDFDKLGYGIQATARMFVSRYAGGVWTDVGLVPMGEFWIHPGAGVLHYGQAVFEGMKARQTRRGEIVLFRAADNARRMAEGCQRLMMPPYDEAQFVAAVTETVLANREYLPGADQGALYIRPVMFATGQVLGVKPAEEYLFLIFVNPVGLFFTGGFSSVKLKVEKEFRRAAAGGIGYTKAAGNYAAGIYAGTAARKRGFVEVLYLDVTNKYIEETNMANFFLRRGEELATPSLEDGTILAGLIRDSVLKLAVRLGLKAAERKIRVEEIFEADECFCTGTGWVVVPVSTVNIDGKDVVVGDGGTGPYTRKIYDALIAIMLKEAPDEYGWVVTIGKK